MDTASQAQSVLLLDVVRKDLANMMTIALPEGKTIDQMDCEDRQSVRNPSDSDTRVTRWKKADGRLLALRQEAKESGEAYEQRKSTWARDQKSWLPA